MRTLVASKHRADCSVYENHWIEPLLETLHANTASAARLLLIFDNCEHVINDACAVAATMLRSCPDVRILATSRESLNIAGERVFRLPSLTIPSPTETAARTKAALRYGAVALFADRARSGGRAALL